jgi:hypothetical protein
MTEDGKPREKPVYNEDSGFLPVLLTFVEIT